MKSPEFRLASASLASSGAGADALAVARRPDGLVLMVADGAGNDARSASLAADTCEKLKAKVLEHPTLPDTKQLLLWIQELDTAATEGECTLAVVASDGQQVWGASVGDSSIWLIRADSYDDLTAAQRRKPLLGSRQAHPERFGPLAFRGALLLGTDGLFKYAPDVRIRHEGTAGNVSVAVARLLDLVRLPSGAVRDDVAVILCRRVVE